MNYNTLVLLKGEPNPKASKVKRKICFTVINSKLEMQVNLQETIQIHALIMKALMDG